MSHGIQYLGKVDSLYDNVRTEFQHGGDFVDQLDERRCGGTSRPKRELIIEDKSGWGTLQRRVDVVTNNYSLHDSRQYWSNGYWREGVPCRRSGKRESSFTELKLVQSVVLRSVGCWLIVEPDETLGQMLLSPGWKDKLGCVLYAQNASERTVGR